MILIDAKIKLNDIQFKVLKMRFIEDKSRDNVADILGYSPQGIRYIENKALRILRTKLHKSYKKG